MVNECSIRIVKKLIKVHDMKSKINSTVRVRLVRKAKNEDEGRKRWRSRKEQKRKTTHTKKRTHVEIATVRVTAVVSNKFANGGCSTEATKDYCGVPIGKVQLQIAAGETRGTTPLHAVRPSILIVIGLRLNDPTVTCPSSKPGREDKSRITLSVPR
jgi:hypothetical protein